MAANTEISMPNGKKSQKPNSLPGALIQPSTSKPEVSLSSHTFPRMCPSITVSPSASASVLTTTSVHNLVSSCHCCGLVLSYPESASKFKCPRCSTTNLLQEKKKKKKKKKSTEEGNGVGVSYEDICKMVDKCMVSVEQDDLGAKSLQTLHSIFEPLSSKLYIAFKSVEVLNKSFLCKKNSNALHYSFCNIDFESVKKSFKLLSKLPTKRPLYNALYGATELLQKVQIQRNEGDDPRELHYILILLEIPFLSKALLPPKSGPNGDMVSIPVVRTLLFEILLRAIGILSNSLTKLSSDYICSWYGRKADFKDKVDMINLYITFILRKYHNGSGRSSDSAGNSSDTKGFLSLNTPLLQPDKIKISQYGNNWQLKSAVKAQSILFKANTRRAKGKRIPCNSFYNSLVDFVQVKLDFDSWQNRKKPKRTSTSFSPPDLQSVVEYIQQSQRLNTSNASFYFCQYPFLISLGAKITILEYEARRKMERKAEEAFIKSLDQKVTVDVFFRVKVRRQYIVQDSLRCIQLNAENLKKSLRVQFIDEVGVDAGGLKKEWFLLLTKSLFSPHTGMLIEVEESNVLWFAMSSIESLEMYYLFGSILGLAIYNSTILDLRFPVCVYKLLLGKSFTFEDYQDIYPDTAANLLKLKNLSHEELLNLDIYFDCTYSDAFGNVYTKDLIENGSKTQVTKENLNKFIEKYGEFFIFEGIKDQLEYFRNGFKTVIGGNALSLFEPEEIELLICGSNENYLDLEVLKSITKYLGFRDREEAESDQVIVWFWEYMYLLNFKQQKKFLLFVTGSDRVPATGLQNLNFKIRIVGNSDTQRLPIAHTCFNELELYSYSSKEKLARKLTTAVEESSGFGIK